MKRLLILSLIGWGLPAVAVKETPKGVLPELRIEGTNEDENQKKALQSEILISKSEQKAIDSLVNILKKRKGTPEEADLWYRLAELYMKRAKSGRFFDLNRDNADAVRFTPSEVKSETAANNLKRAIQVYTKIDREFPRFKDMDSVLFNAAFASQQVGLHKQAEQFYLKMVTQHSKSQLVPDGQLALGEIKYHAQNFKGALEHFMLIQKFPKSRVYSYGMYKSAWTFYNLHQTDKAIEKLIEVVKYYNPTKKAVSSYNLRLEAIRDLTIFFEETSTPDKAHQFFAAITTPEELGEAMVQLGKIYNSHSRFKEMNVFLNDFITKEPNSPARIKAQLLMVEANESLKNRKEVIAQLNSLSEVCKKDSTWALENAKTYDESCNFDFAKANIDVAKKWWDIWLKNKNNKEFSDLTRHAFKIYLDREDPTKPDSKSRYAYAELLFQLDDFKAASEQYVIVGNKTQDTVLRHDSDYAALVAFEKGSEKSKASGDAQELLELCQRYLKKNPTGEHATQVQFKVGFINYESKNFDEAEKWLKPLAESEKSGEFKRKSEDLVLDILNARKDYKGIKEFSKTILAHTKEDDRKSSLTKIMQEADYTEIQDYAKSGEKTLAAQKLYGFYLENKASPLAKDSLWQALSLNYSGGHPVDAADMAQEYVKAYPDNSRSVDALKDAAKAYADNGHLMAAAKTMELIAEKSPKEAEKYTDAAAELYLLEGNRKLAVSTFSKLLTDKNKDNHAKIYTKILSTMKGQENTGEYQQMEAKVAALGQEPFASELKLKRVQQLFDSKKLNDAFNAAKPLVSSERGTPDEVRAKARLIQARVLEDEFVAQSTKTSIEKLSVILSLKTEKLDKAQTAFLTAAKISKDPNVQLEALQGLNRIYKNYVETVGHPIIKTNLKDDEKVALQTELDKLTKPMAEKLADTSKKLVSLAKESKVSRSDDVDYANLPPSESIKARIKNLPADRLAPFLPLYSVDAKTEFQESIYTRFSSVKAEKCTLTDQEKSMNLASLTGKANACVSQANWDTAEKVASQMTRNQPQSGLGTYYMSVIAELKNQNEKALWLIDLSLKRTQDSLLAAYQKARVLYKMKDYAAANKLFLKVYDEKLAAPEILLMHGILSYAEGDCYTLIEDFSKLDGKAIYNHGLGAAYAECHAQKGEMDKGFALIKNQLQFNPNNVELLLQAAYMNEIYKSDSLATIKAYETALKAASQPEMKDWIQRKVDYLKGTRGSVSAAQPSNEEIKK